MKKVFYKENSSSFSTGSANPSDYSEGEKVEHERFGEGIIITIEGEQPNQTALVEFAREGRKKLLLRFAKLRKI
jgi:DNA helicase-2/ATP-dependent DNA helicase PcrA